MVFEDGTVHVSLGVLGAEVTAGDIESGSLWQYVCIQWKGLF